MISTQELILLIRYDLRDTSKASYSEHQILDVINTVAKTTVTTLARSYSKLIEKEVDIPLTNNEADLPSDFLSIVTVKSGSIPLLPQSDLDNYGYRITKDKIKANATTLNVVYRYTIPKIINGSTIDLPDWFVESIRKYSSMILEGTIPRTSAELQTMIQQDLSYLIAGREYTEIYREPPFSL